MVRRALLATALFPALPPPGMTLWWEPDSYNSSTGAWIDKSGNAINGTSPSIPTFNAAGLNGRPTVTSDGVANKSLSGTFTLLQPYTIGLVFRHKSGNSAQWSSANRIIDSNAGDVIVNQYHGVSQLSCYARTAFTCFNGGAEINAWSYVEISMNGSSSFIRINGGPATTGNPGTTTLTTGFTLFAGSAGFFSNIELAALLFWPRAFSSSDRSTWEGWVHGRWGIYRSWLRSLSFAGDSLTAGSGVTLAQAMPAQCQANLDGRWGTVKNEGIASQTFVSGDGNWTAGSTGQGFMGDLSVDGGFDLFGENIWYGANDFLSVGQGGGGFTAAQTITNATTFATNRRAASSAAIKLALVSTIARGTSGFSESDRQSYLTSIRTPATLASMGYDFLVDLAADAAFSDFTNTTWYQLDQTHLTAAGYARAGLLTAQAWAAQFP